MKKAAAVLGIAGGAIPLIFLFIVLIMGENIKTPVYGLDTNNSELIDGSMNGIIFIGLIFGIIGGILVYQNSIGGGIFMIIGSLLASNLLLLLGGIFALREKPQNRQYIYPPYPYPPYMPQNTPYPGQPPYPFQSPRDTKGKQ